MATIEPLEPPQALVANDDWPRWRRRLHEIIFEADTRAGVAFDAFLLIAIVGVDLHRSFYA